MPISALATHNPLAAAATGHAFVAMGTSVASSTKGACIAVWAWLIKGGVSMAAAHVAVMAVYLVCLWHLKSGKPKALNRPSAPANAPSQTLKSLRSTASQCISNVSSIMS